MNDALFGLAVAVSALWVAVAAAIASAPVGRGRLERFARRHALTVTTGNGTAVIRYLGTTRRWRVTGLTVGLLVSFARSLPREAVTVDFLALFAGWFAGAVAAEMRVVRPHLPPRRSASLTVRRRSAYLPALAWWLPPAAAAVSVAVAVGGRSAATARESAALALVAIAIAAVVVLTQAHAVRRAQPAGPPDEIAADDAIRSRSLHVLAGSGGALVLYCVLAQLAVLGFDPGFPGVVAVALVGAAVATEFWPVRRPAEPGRATA